MGSGDAKERTTGVLVVLGPGTAETLGPLYRVFAIPDKRIFSRRCFNLMSSRGISSLRGRGIRVMGEPSALRRDASLDRDPADGFDLLFLSESLSKKIKKIKKLRMKKNLPVLSGALSLRELGRNPPETGLRSLERVPDPGLDLTFNGEAPEWADEGRSKSLAIWCIFFWRALTLPLVNLVLAAMQRIWSSNTNFAEIIGPRVAALDDKGLEKKN